VEEPPDVGISPGQEALFVRGVDQARDQLVAALGTIWGPHLVRWREKERAVWDAAHVRARLSAMAVADPECAVFGAGRHRYRLGARLSESKVTRFERRYGITLPASYRAFVTEIGDGGAGPYYGLYRLDGSDIPARDRDDRGVPGFLATPFPHVAAWNPNAEHSPERMSDDEYFAPQWSAGSLVVAEYGCGAFFRLVVSGPACGQVWFDDRAADGGLTPGPDFRDWYLAWLDEER
jgi:hypothetical protein